MTSESDIQADPEISAISQVYSTLKVLQPEAQLRVLKYVSDKLNLKMPSGSAHERETEVTQEHQENPPQEHEAANRRSDLQDEDSDGVSPAGRKWIIRNGLSVDELSSIFSIGGEEIDLVVKKVPGESKSKRMRSVFLLKGLASYLGSGAARFAHKDVKETALHYDAFDAGNFAVHFRSLAGEVSGSKETGYTLTARGISAAAEIVKKMAKKTE